VKSENEQGGNGEICRPDIDFNDKNLNIYQAQYPIHVYEVDPRGNLSVLSVCNFLQDAGSAHAAKLGISVLELQNKNYTWVLARMKIRMHAYPFCRKQLKVYTWPSGCDRLFALRDFYVTDSGGRPVCSAVSSFVIIDTGNRRPVRVQSFIDQIKPVGVPHVLPDKPVKLPEPERLDLQQRFRVRYRDMDINQHVNNVSYIEWAVESAPHHIKRNHLISELEINFLREAVFGDCILGGCRAEDQSDNEFLHSMVRENDGLEVARARTVWMNGEL